MTFRRLTLGHALAFVAALALVLVMAMDWWTDKVGEQDRYFQHQIVPQANNETTPTQSQLQADAAMKHEKNAWQAPALIDKIILISLLAAVLLAIAAAFVRATGRRGPPLSALATVVGLFATVLVAYRIMQPPGLNAAAVVKAGAPLGLLCVGLLTLGSRMATRSAAEEPAKSDGAPEAPAAAPATPAT